MCGVFRGRGGGSRGVGVCWGLAGCWRRPVTRWPRSRGCRARRCWTSTSSATAPNRKRITDVTEHPSGQAEACSFAVEDLSGKRIAGCAIRDGVTAELAVAALRAAHLCRNTA